MKRPGHAPKRAALIFRRRLLPWSETFIAEQGRALSRYHPVFVGYRRQAGGIDYLAGQDVVVLEDHSAAPRLSRTALRMLGWVTPAFRRALADAWPAVVHGHFGGHALDASAIARTFDLPLVVTYHGMDIAVDGGTSSQRHRHKVFDRADRLIAVSEFIAARLREAGAPADKIVVHHIGVDTERFSPPSQPREPAQILFVGRLVPKKGLIHLLRTLPRLQAEVPGVELVVAGDGPLRKELEDAATALGARVRFLGVRTPEQVRDLMRTAAILCAPSVVASDGNTEGLPMTIMEAQATGLPVVAFAAGGAAEGVRHGETGLIAAPGDEERLGDHLLELLRNDDQRAWFGEAARAWVLADFDLRTQSARLEDLYDAVR